jgi:adenine-specific DNA-methyltransferase
MTELIWDGKYKDGKKTAPVRIALPFQTIETVNESVQHKERTIEEYIHTKDKWYNRLIWGDKKYVLPSLLPEFAGKVNLIYIDPPFDTGANFSFTATIPDNPETEEDETAQFVKQPSMIEQKAYRDTWGKGLDSYLQWFYETAIILRELLAENGSIYVHLDWHVGHYAKAVLDEVFGMDKFINEIIWKRSSNVSSIGKIYKRQHDTLLLYSKADSYTFNFQRKPLSNASVEIYKMEDEKGAYQSVPLLVSGIRKGATGSTWKGVDPNSKGRNGMHWVTTPTKLDEYDKKGLILWPKIENGTPRLKYYLEDNPGVVVSDIWDDISIIHSSSPESLSYTTQKPEVLLDRILQASSNNGDLVLDCFCGSGTTSAVAEKLNRRWITCDLGRFAIHTTRKRLLGIQNVKPFIVQNLGKYERQQWIETEFEDNESKIAVQKRYKQFITELYHGDQLDGYDWIHGVKNGRMIHVGNVEAPITIEDIKAAILEYWKLSSSDGKGCKGIDFLGWDFAFDVNQTAKEYAKTNNVDVHFKKIPREVLEKKAVEQGDIKFYELAYLDVKADKHKNKKVTVKLTDFIVPTDDIPKEIQSNITHWSQWIDYWAVDWDYCEDTFHNQWQSYRTKQSPKIELSADKEYEESGSYTVVVKVIDILGNDTTKSITIEV